MTWDRVPHFTGGGAPNSAASMRTAQYVATGGARGIVEPGDLKVTALPAPGPQVRVGVGGALIPSKYPGDTQQSYSPRNPTIDPVGIAATGAGSGRSDLVYVSIEDPYASGSTFPPPANPTDPDARFVFTRVIPNVSPTVRRLQDVPGYENATGYELARIDIPASTAAITNAMIVDLRRVAIPQTDSTQVGTYPTGTKSLNAVSPTRENFPDLSHSVYVPEWATHVLVKITLAGYEQRIGQADAYLWAQMDGADVGPALPIDADYIIDGLRHTSVIVAERAIPAAWLGQTKALRLQGTNYANRPGRFRVVEGSQITFEPVFSRRAV